MHDRHPQKSTSTRCREDSTPTCKSQVESFGLGHKFNEVKDMYKAVNQMLGDIVKVTPSSKAGRRYGDLHGAERSDAGKYRMRRAKDIDFPDSIVSYFEGMMGQPEGGFPEDTPEAGASRARSRSPADRANCCRKKTSTVSRSCSVEKYGLEGTEKEALSYALYPKVFEDYLKSLDKEGDFRLMGSDIFFHGLI